MSILRIVVVNEIAERLQVSGKHANCLKSVPASKFPATQIVRPLFATDRQNISMRMVSSLGRKRLSESEGDLQKKSKELCLLEQAAKRPGWAYACCLNNFCI
jgi:hypothetical protein